MADRSFALVHTADQWLRTAHEHTALIGSVLQLHWQPDEHDVSAPANRSPIAAGLAWDPWCRLYHSLPEQGQVERILWRTGNSRLDPLPWFARPLEQPSGDFGPVESPSPLARPRALAVTDEGRLFVGETAAPRIVVVDLFERRLLRHVSIPSNARPLDMASDGRQVFILVDSAPYLYVLDAWSDIKPATTVATVLGSEEVPVRLARHPTNKQLVLLAKVEVATGEMEVMRVIPLAHPDDAFTVPFATDLEFIPEGEPPESWLLVVARGIGQDFARYDIRPGTVTQVGDLKARGYDGRGIVRAPDGRVVYRSDHGKFRHAVTARVRYLRRGRVTTFQLDSGRFQTQWGRIFLDACIPNETDVRIVCAASDEPPEEVTLPRTPPANSLSVTIQRPDLSPPMPPSSWIPAPDAKGQRLHARVSGRELPWSRRADGDPFRTYEAPVIADAGRYLWVTILLTGNSQSTPRIKSLRVEYPEHDLLRRLPRVYSRGEQVDFLRRYLAIFDGVLSELELRAFHRHALLDPSSTPAELLPWLGGLTGMLVDQRFSERAKRRLVQESISLFRMRGTIQGLQRILELYLEVTPIIVEHYRARGLGGAYVGEQGDLTSRAVVGAGFRVGGKIGNPASSSVDPLPAKDAFRLHAHRFSIIVPASLSTEQADVVNDLLELHRPAHTQVDVCTVDAGMRIGLGLYAGLTSIVGRTSGFGSVRTGNWLLGRRDVIGRASPAGRIGSGRIGIDSVTG